MSHALAVMGRWTAAGVGSLLAASVAAYASVPVYFAYAGTDVAAPSLPLPGAVAMLLFVWGVAGAVTAIDGIALARPRLARWVGPLAWIYAVQDIGGWAFLVAVTAGFAGGVLGTDHLVRRNNGDGLVDLTFGQTWQAPRR